MVYHIKTILKQRLFEKDVINVFTYSGSDSVLPTIAELQLFLENFENAIVSPMRALVSTEVFFDKAEVSVYEDPLASVATRNFGYNGNMTGECLPAYFTYYFKMYVGTKVTRPGRKSISGVSESVYLSEFDINPVHHGVVLAFSNALGNDIFDGVRFWTPSILKTTVDTSSGQTIILAEQPVIGAFFQRFSTQNSRKG